MEKDEKDDFLEEIDRELENLNKRLKQTLSEADALLSQHFGEGSKPGSEEIRSEEMHEDGTEEAKGDQ